MRRRYKTTGRESKLNASGTFSRTYVAVSRTFLSLAQRPSKL